jgi:hypothetical protein
MFADNDGTCYPDTNPFRLLGGLSLICYQAGPRAPLHACTVTRTTIGNGDFCGIGSVCVTPDPARGGGERGTCLQACAGSIFPDSGPVCGLGTRCRPFFGLPYYELGACLPGCMHDADCPAAMLCQPDWLADGGMLCVP